MIRTRLALVLAVLAILSLLQAGFTVWATLTAMHHAERSVLASRMQSHYLEMAADKQRLKVWFAQSALIGDASESIKLQLLANMQLNTQNLQDLVVRAQHKAAFDVSLDEQAISALQRNLLGMREVVSQPIVLMAMDSEATRLGAWQAMLRAFDQADGQDMRATLVQADVRLRAQVQSSETELQSTLSRLNWSAAGLASLVLSWALLAALYFRQRLQQPFAALTGRIDALAEGRYDSGLPSGRKDEFARVDRQLDSLAQRLSAARTQAQALHERSEAVRSGLDAAVAARTRELGRSEEALMALDARRRQFIAEVSHELRTPITVIRGEAELSLRRRGSSEEHYRDTLLRVMQATDDLSLRVEDLLRLARSDGDLHALQFEVCRVADIVSGAVQHMRAVAEHRQVQLVEPALPSAEILLHADPNRLRQALIGLIDNAIRYSPAGSQVRLGVVHDHESVAIQVIDEGIGMSASERERALERNFRGEQARRLRPDGEGLGLSIADTIARAHGGRVVLAASPQALDQAHPGSQVSLELPLWHTGTGETPQGDLA